MARRPSDAAAGPVFVALVLFSALLQPCIVSSRALLDKPDDLPTGIGLPDDAVSKRKVNFTVTVTNGTCHNLAVFVYELSGLAGDDGDDAQKNQRSRVPHECKKNQDVAVVLLHGATYNHKYWDAPAAVDGFEHSLARYLAKQCFYVLAPDMLGTGDSDKPDGFTTTLADQTHATADFIRAIKANHNPARAHKAKKVVVVGHSFGSIQGDLLLGTNPGIADAFVATGWANGYQPVAPDFGQLFELIKAAYITLPTDPTGPFGNLRALFYAQNHASWSDAMLTYDVANLVDYITYQDAFDTILSILDNRRGNAANDPTFIFQHYHTDQITVPVFILCGDQDVFADAAGCATGGLYYPNAASVATYVQSNIGHVYNLHQTNRQGWEKIAEFVKSVA